MSTPPPSEPNASDGETSDAPAAPPTEAYPAAAAPPTEAYPAADAQPTQAYPAADAQPTQAYPAATGGYGDAYVAPTAPPLPPMPPNVPPQAPYGQAPHGQAPYGQASYGQQPYGAPAQAPYGQSGYDPQPTAPDTRSKAIAWTALSLAAVGTVLSLIGLVPVPWVGLVTVIIGGLLLLAGFIFSIVGLAGRRYGGKALSVTALVLSIVGATIGSFALIWSLITLGLSAAGSSIDDMIATPSPVPSAEISQGGTPSPEADDAAPSAAQQAFIADVRPKVNDIFAEVDPTATADVVEQVLPDSTLITIGQTLLVTGDSGVEDLVQQTITSIGGDASAADLLRTLYREILASAKTYLQ